MDFVHVIHWLVNFLGVGDVTTVSAKKKSLSSSDLSQDSILKSSGKYLHRASLQVRLNEAAILFNDLGWGNLTDAQKLSLLGNEITKMKCDGKSTKYLESLVSAVLGINAEPQEEDIESASDWENRYRS